MHWVAVFVLFLVVIGYMLLGAFVFSALETNDDDDNTSVKVDDTLITQFLENTTYITRERLEAFAKDVINQYNTGVLPYNQSVTTTNDDKWDITDGFFFCATIVTTIGYGHMSPTTTGGKIFCIFYMFVGIPIMGVFLVGVGTKVVEPIKAMKNRSTNKKIKIMTSVFISLMGFVVLIFAPAIAFHFVEKWTFLDSVYFSVVTLTTVGFGDFVPGQVDKDYRLLYRILLVVWTLLGLAWVAASIADIADYVTETVHEKTAKLAVRKKKNTPAKNGNNFRQEIKGPGRRYIEP